MKLVDIYEEVVRRGEYYHGTRWSLPFESFDNRMIGKGVVSSGTKYGGFFFTSELDNAKYYSEYWVAKVAIKNIEVVDFTSHPPTALKQAVETRRNYLIRDTYDGSMYSDVVVVPEVNTDGDVRIIEWISIVDVDDLHQAWDELFFDDEDDSYRSKESVESMISMTGGGLEYLLAIPQFNEYYNMLDG